MSFQVFAIIKEIYFSCQLEGMATGSLWQLQGDQFTQKVFHRGTKSHISLEKNKNDYSRVYLICQISNIKTSLHVHAHFQLKIKVYRRLYSRDSL